jgi:hypothetical protein
LSILQIQYMLQYAFDSMVDYAASHGMDVPESFGKVGDALVMRLVNSDGVEYKATIHIGLEVVNNES